MLDCARHFMDKIFVMRYIDLLAMHKMNRFHWHLVDDQGWRLHVRKRPELTRVGGTRRDPRTGTVHTGWYSREDIQEVVAYAALHHIDIIPEVRHYPTLLCFPRCAHTSTLQIEIPGHVTAAVASTPGLCCTRRQLGVPSHSGIFDDVLCSDDAAVAFIQDVIEEVVELFPTSPFVHLGGDECPTGRWEQCPRCKKRMREQSIESPRYGLGSEALR
jgi:hexosaminidase